ncbi:MAG: 50S ribosomal protein L3 [bacterium]
MPMGLIGKKIGMTQVLRESGEVVPVTVIQVGPCTVVQKKVKGTDHYNALQLGFLDKRESRTNKPLQGHFKKAGLSPKKFLKEIRLDDSEIDQYEVGQEIKADFFSAGDYIDVVGTSKGRGFAGVIKRHGFRGAPGSHGTHDYSRHGGSVGSNTYPGRVFKGLRMAGHMGNSRVTIQNLKIEDVRPEQNLVLIKGAVPGANNGVVVIRKAVKKAAKKETSKR